MPGIVESKWWLTDEIVQLLHRVHFRKEIVVLIDGENWFHDNFLKQAYCYFLGTFISLSVLLRPYYFIYSFIFLFQLTPWGLPKLLNGENRRPLLWLRIPLLRRFRWEPQPLPPSMVMCTPVQTSCKSFLAPLLQL